jgi:hypothetical protein
MSEKDNTNGWHVMTRQTHPWGFWEEVVPGESSVDAVQRIRERLKLEPNDVTVEPMTLAQWNARVGARWEAQNQARLARLSTGGRRTLALLVEAHEVWSIHRRDNKESFPLRPTAEGLIALAALISSERKTLEEAAPPATTRPEPLVEVDVLSPRVRQFARLIESRLVANSAAWNELQGKTPLHVIGLCRVVVDELEYMFTSKSSWDVTNKMITIKAGELAAYALHLVSEGAVIP